MEAIRAIAASLLSALVLCLAHSTLDAQSANRAGTRVISGVVSSAASGQPLAGANVTLRDTSIRDFPIVAGAISDDQGRFVFANPADGRFALSAWHRGYVAAGFEEHDGAFTAIVTGENLNTTGLALSLPPLGAIFGTVTEDSGDPVPQARLLLFRKIRRNGTERIERAGQVIADDMGNFELAHLAPGSYFLCASGTPWYRPRSAPMLPGSDGGDSGQARSPLDAAYPPTCYADTTGPAGAEPIPLSAGDRLQANLTLHPVPAVHILFHAPKPSPDRGIAMPQLNQEVFGISDPVQAGGSVIPNRNGSDPDAGPTMEISGVAPGQYALEWAGADPSRDSPRTAVLAVSSSDVSFDASALQPMASVSGKLIVAGGELPSSAAIALVTTRGEWKGSAAIESDGSFQLRGVSPGEYGVTITGSGFSLAITHLKANGAKVADGNFNVGNDPVELTVTAVKPSTSVTGFVTLNGKPASGVFVLMVPSSPNIGRFAMQLNQSDSDGSFVFPLVIPGQYRVVAIEQGWRLDWSQGDVIGPYLARGTSVTVAPNAQKVDLETPVEAQAIGAPQTR